MLSNYENVANIVYQIEHVINALWEELEGTKGVIGVSKPKKNRQTQWPKEKGHEKQRQTKN